MVTKYTIVNQKKEEGSSVAKASLSIYPRAMV
jgi:hypothetical protein